MQDKPNQEEKFEGSSRFVEKLLSPFNSYERMGNELELIHKQRLREKKQEEQKSDSVQ